MKLTELVGKHTLTGRGKYVASDPATYYLWGRNNARVEVLLLDGKAYAFVEDADDGYRSSLRDVYVLPPELLPKGSTTSFQAREVTCTRHTKDPGSPYSSKDDLLLVVDNKTGKLLAKLGTDNLNDYYPSFVAEWYPPED